MRGLAENKNDQKINVLEMLLKCSHRNNSNSIKSSDPYQSICPNTSNQSQKKNQGKLVQLNLSSFTKSNRTSENLAEFCDEPINQQHKILQSTDRSTYQCVPPLLPFTLEFENIQEEYQRDLIYNYNLSDEDLEKYEKEYAKTSEVKSDKQRAKFTPGNNLLAFVRKIPKQSSDITQCRQGQVPQPVFKLNWKEINNQIKKSSYFAVPIFMEVEQQEEEESLSVEVLSGGPDDEEERRQDFMNKIKKQSEPSKMSVDFIIKPMKPMKMQIGGRNKRQSYQQINAIAVTFHSEQITYQMDFQSMRKAHPEIIKSLFESFI